jgi:hypothetical protein
VAKLRRATARDRKASVLRVDAIHDVRFTRSI